MIIAKIFIWNRLTFEVFLTLNVHKLKPPFSTVSLFIIHLPITQCTVSLLIAGSLTTLLQPYLGKFTKTETAVICASSARSGRRSYVLVHFP